MPKPAKPKVVTPPAPTAADLALHQAEQDRKDAPKIAALLAEISTCAVCGNPKSPPNPCAACGN